MMMKSLLKLVLLSVVVLVASTEKKIGYDRLQSDLRPHIDKAIIKANQKFRHLQQHINFESHSGNQGTSSKPYVRVKLMTTVCPAGTSEGEFKQRQDCAFKGNGTPWVDCVVCKHKEKDEDHIDCALYREQTKRNQMKDMCDDYLPGGKISMHKSTGSDNDLEFGCVGCV